MLASRLTGAARPAELVDLPHGGILAQMTRGIFGAGFGLTVIDSTWPDFETA